MTNAGVNGYPAAAAVAPVLFPSSVDPGIIRSSDVLAMIGSNQAVYSRCRDGGVVSKIGLHVGTQSGNLSVGVFRNSGVGRSAVPGVLLATSGAVACPSGYAEIALNAPATLNPGDWIALSVDNVTATFKALLSTAADTNLGLGRQYRQTTAHPLPALPSGLIAIVGGTYCLVGIA